MARTGFFGVYGKRTPPFVDRSVVLACDGFQWQHPEFFLCRAF